MKYNNDFVVDEFLKHLKKLLDDLNLIYQSNKLEAGKSSALLLSFCYIESFGKMYLYSKNEMCPNSRKIFIKVFSKYFNCTKKEANLAYVYFRCDLVHSIPIQKNHSFTTKEGENLELNFDLISEKLNILFEDICKKDWEPSDIALCDQWRPQQIGIIKRYYFKLKYLIKGFINQSSGKSG